MLDHVSNRQHRDTIRAAKDLFLDPSKIDAQNVMCRSGDRPGR
jgi:hypothetical protein